MPKKHNFLKDAFIGAIIGAGVLLSAFAVMIFKGAIPIPFMEGVVRSEIAKSFPEFNIGFAHMDMRWNGEEQAIRLGIANTEIDDKKGRISLIVPQTTIALKLASLMKGEVELSQITLHQASLSLNDDLLLDAATPAKLNDSAGMTNILMQHLALDDFFIPNMKDGRLLHQDWVMKLDMAFQKLGLGELDIIAFKQLTINMIDDKGMRLSEIGPLGFALTRQEDGFNQLTLKGYGFSSDTIKNNAQPLSELELKIAYHPLMNVAGLLELQLSHLSVKALPIFVRDILSHTAYDQIMPKAAAIDGFLSLSIDRQGRPVRGQIDNIITIDKGELKDIHTAKMVLDFKEGLREIRVQGDLSSNDFMALAELAPADLKEILPFYYDGKIDLKLEAKISDMDRLEMAKFTLKSPDGRLEYQGGNFILQNMQIGGDFRDDELWLAPISVDFGGLSSGDGQGENEGAYPHLTATGSIKNIKLASSHIAVDEAEISLEANLSHYRMEWLPKHWPHNLYPDARDWVIDNIKLGDVSKADIFMNLGREDETDGLTLKHLSGTLGLVKAIVNYQAGMPVARGVKGTATYDINEMKIKLQHAEIKDVFVNDGEINILDQKDAPPLLSAKLPLKGSTKDAFGLLKNLPAKVGQELDMPDIKAPVGTFEGLVEFNAPIDENIKPQEFDYKANLVFNDFRLAILENVKDEIDFETLSVEVDKNQIIAQGQGLWQHIEDPALNNPFTFIFNKKADTSIEELQIKGEVTQSLLQAFDIKQDWFEEGSIKLAFSRKIEGKTGAITDYEIKADAEKAKLFFAPLGYDKPMGSAGEFSAQIRQAANGDLKIDDLTFIDAQNNQIKGNIELAKRGEGWDGFTPLNLKFEVFNLSNTQLSHLEYKAGQKIKLVIKGKQLDLYGLQGKALKEDRNQDIESLLLPLEGTIFHGEMALERLILTQNAILPNFDLKFDWDKDRFERLALSSSTAAGQNLLRVNLSHEASPSQFENMAKETIMNIPNGRRLSMNGQDVSLLTHALGMAGKIEGGAFEVIALEDAQKNGMHGMLKVDEFTVLEAPTMAKLLQALSLTGIFSTFSETGLVFNQLNSEFNYEKGQIEVIKSVANGTPMSMTSKGNIDLSQNKIDLEGVVVPAYILNQFIAQIPILGQILTGIEGEGIIATRYSMSGSIDDPIIAANPLSTFTPGLFRDLLGAITEGGDKERQNKSDLPAKAPIIKNNPNQVQAQPNLSP